MDKHQQENLMLLAVYLGQSNKGTASARLAVQYAKEIHKYSRRLSVLAEIECNREVTERERREEERLQKRVNALLKPYDLRARFEGDPRGYVVKIQGLPGNTWGGDSEGFGVG